MQHGVQQRIGPPQACSGHTLQLNNAAPRPQAFEIE
jgi:hypothetical protein